MQDLINISFPFDGKPLVKAIQILFKEDGSAQVLVTAEEQPEVYMVGLSTNVGAVVNQGVTQIVDSPVGELKILWAANVRICIFKEIRDICPDHRDFIIEQVLPENPPGAKILVSEYPPAGYTHEYFLGVPDTIQYEIRHRSKIGNLSVLQ